MSARDGGTAGLLLVIGQFAGIGTLLVAGGRELPWWAWVLFVLGLLVFAAAWLSIGAGNITVMPEPVQGNSLSKRGIYGIVRHPMYLSVLLCGTAVAAGAPTPVRWATLLLLFVVLLLKIRHEEHRLTVRHPEYPVVMKGVARLLPGVW